MTDARIRRAGPDRLDELEPLWAAMQRHHEEVTPVGDVVGFRDVDESWERRVALYRVWLADRGSRLYVAELEDGGVVGYALVILGSGWSQLDTPDRVAELASLSVAPAHRGQGIGTRLLEAAHVGLRERGIEHMSVVVFAGNDGARRLYEAHGMRPMNTHLLGRVPPV